MAWLKKLKAEGHRVPGLDDEPEIGPWFLYWRAFNDLTTCRHWTDSPGPIPWIAIDAWARRYRITGQAFGDFSRVIQIVDNHYLAAYSDKLKTERLKHGRSNKSCKN